MNNQDAIKNLKNIVEYWTYRPTEIEAAELSISALEKQIPKKPIEEQGIAPRCPYCENANYLTNEDEEVNNYCGNCGQAIDWRNEE